MFSYWRTIAAGILSGVLLLALLSVFRGGADDVARAGGEGNDLKPLETKVLFTIPARLHSQHKSGALLYDRSPGHWRETVCGLAVSNGHIQVWDSQRLLEFNQEGNLVRESEAPAPTSIALVYRSGPSVVSLAYREGFSLRLSDQHGAEVATLGLPEDEYPHPHLLQYYDGDSYLGIFGTEPEEVRSLTLYSISPEGLTRKIKLPARVLFGGSHEQLMPDGTKYYVEYLREQNCYQVVKVRYSLKALGLPEPPDATKPLVDYRVQILQLKPLGAKALTLSPDHFLTTGAEGQTKRVPVVMKRVTYKIDATIQVGETVKEWSGNLWWYELRSADPQRPYSYSFWVTYSPERDAAPVEGVEYWPPYDLELFSHENGDKFLADSRSHDVWVMDVSKPNDKIVALEEYLASMQKEPFMSAWGGEVAMAGGQLGRAADRHWPVPVLQFIGPWHFGRAYGPLNIKLEAVYRDDNGNLSVCVSGPEPNTGIRPGTIYTLVLDGEQWRVE